MDTRAAPVVWTIGPREAALTPKTGLKLAPGVPLSFATLDSHLNGCCPPQSFTPVREGERTREQVLQKSNPSFARFTAVSPQSRLVPASRPSSALRLLFRHACSTGGLDNRPQGSSLNPPRRVKAGTRRSTEFHSAGYQFKWLLPPPVPSLSDASGLNDPGYTKRTLGLEHPDAQLYNRLTLLFLLAPSPRKLK